MSKLVNVKGTINNVNQEAAEIFNVKNLKGEFTASFHQFIENQQNPAYVYGAPNMSGDGLYCVQTSTNQVAELWHRSSIYGDFVFVRSFPSTGTVPFGKLSFDAGVIALNGSGPTKVYERDPITDIYTLTFTGASSIFDTSLSSDGNTLIIQNSQPSLYVYQRTSPGTWTQLASLIPASFGGDTHINNGTTFSYSDTSDDGEFIASFSRYGVSFWSRNIDGITYTETPQVAYDGIYPDVKLSNSLSGDGNYLLVSDQTRTALWKRLPSWTKIYQFDITSYRSQMSKDMTTVRIGDFIYKACNASYTKWCLTYTLPAPIEYTNGQPAFNFDYYGDTFMTSASNAGSTVYSIRNKVNITEILKTKILNLDDKTTFIPSASGTNYKMVLPEDNALGPLYNDGLGNLTFNVASVKVPNMSAPVDPEEIKNYINSIKNTNAESYIIPYVHGSTETLNGYAGGVYTPSGRIYLIPHAKSNEASWEYIDSNGAVVTYTHGNTDIVSHAYSGGCFSPKGSGRIFMAYSGQASQTNWQYISSDGSVVSWAHGVTTASINSICYSPENGGRVFLICDASSTAQPNWHYIDGSTTPPTVTPYAHGQTDFLASSYRGCVYTPENSGRIFLIPNTQHSQPNLHYIDCSTPNPILVSYPKGVALTGTYWGGAYSATQGRVYMTPYGAGSSATWAYIDVTTQVPTVVSYTHPLVSTSSSNPWIGACFSPTDNKIYFSPYGTSSGNWIYIDCEDGSVHYLQHDGVTIGGLGYRFMSYHPILNRIYAIPSFTSTTWHYVQPLTTNKANPSLMMSAMYNKA